MNHKQYTPYLQWLSVECHGSLDPATSVRIVLAAAEAKRESPDNQALGDNLTHHGLYLPSAHPPVRGQLYPTWYQQYVEQSDEFIRHQRRDMDRKTNRPSGSLHYLTLRAPY